MVSLGAINDVKLLLRNAQLQINYAGSRKFCAGALERAFEDGSSDMVDLLLQQEDLVLDDKIVKNIVAGRQADLLEKVVASGRLNPTTWRSSPTEEWHHGYSGLSTLLHLAVRTGCGHWNCHKGEHEMLDLILTYTRIGLDGCILLPAIIYNFSTF